MNFLGETINDKNLEHSKNRKGGGIREIENFYILEGFV